MEWISVEDRLPENDDEVLALFIGWDDMKVIRTLEYDKGWEEWSDWNGQVYKNITHWAKMPEPPK